MSETAIAEDERSGGRLSRLSVRKYVALVVAGVAILQLVWIAVVPPFRGVDEFDHAYRAAGVAGGQFRSTDAPENGRGLLVEVPADLVLAAQDQCEALGYTGPDNCSAVEDLGDGRVSVASGAGGYNPAFYWVVGNVAASFSGTTALYVMRATTALLCLMFIGMAAWCLAQRTGARWTRLGAVVAIPPVMLYSTTVAAPNGVEMSAAMAFWAALLSMDGSLAVRVERRVLAVAGTAAAVLMVDRTLGPLFAVTILFLVWSLYPDLVRRTLDRHKRAFAAWTVVVLAFVAWGITWFVLSGAGRPAPERQGGAWSWTALILWPFQSIAAFPLREQPGPLVVYPVFFLAFAALVGAALRVGDLRQRLVLSSALVLAMAVPLVLTAATYDGRGAMWQGRYGLPLSLGIVLLAAVILDSRGWSTRFRPGLLLTGSVLMAVASGACFVKLVDDELLRAASANDSGWHAPSALIVVVATGVAWLILHLSYARGERVAS